MTDDPHKTSRDGMGEGITAGGTRHVAVVDNRIESRDLFVNTRDIVIGHGDDSYRLRLTAQNKLILTK